MRTGGSVDTYGNQIYNEYCPSRKVFLQMKDGSDGDESRCTRLRDVLMPETAPSSNVFGFRPRYNGELSPFIFQGPGLNDLYHGPFPSTRVSPPTAAAPTAAAGGRVGGRCRCILPHTSSLPDVTPGP